MRIKERQAYFQKIMFPNRSSCLGALGLVLWTIAGFLLVRNTNAPGDANATVLAGAPWGAPGEQSSYVQAPDAFV